MGDAKIKQIKIEENRIMQIVEKRIKQFLKNNRDTKTVLIHSKFKNQLTFYQPLKSHFHFKSSYFYLKRFLGKF